MGRRIPPSPTRCPAPACRQPAGQPAGLRSWVRRVCQSFAALSRPPSMEGKSGSLLVAAGCPWERLAPWVLALMLPPLFAPGRTHRSLPAIPSESPCRDHPPSLLPPHCKKSSPHLLSTLPSSLLLTWHGRRGSRDKPETLQEPNEMVADPSSLDVISEQPCSTPPAPLVLAVNQQVPH